jgi:hypothetical protein
MHPIIKTYQFLFLQTPCCLYTWGDFVHAYQKVGNRHHGTRLANETSCPETAKEKPNFPSDLLWVIFT